MIYFKLTDKESDAWARHQEYKTMRSEAFNMAKALREELNIDSDKFHVHLGSITSWVHAEGDHVPEGMLVRDGRLVVDNRMNAGKDIKKRMKAIHFPTQSDYMKRIFGAAGEDIQARKWYTGCGMAASEDMVLIKMRPKVYEDAEPKDGFAVPDACVEITGREYQELYSKMFPNK